MDTLLTTLKRDFNHISFTKGDVFTWSPKDQTIIIASTAQDDQHSIWSLLHEMGHALLGHASYKTDFELVQLETAAWHKAQELATQYGYKIDPDHIEDCLDTYRDWLHQRSACPICTTTSLQINSTIYHCHNCSSEWNVSRTRLCRPYRRLTTAI